MLYPAMDPIPVPAPVWLMKGLLLLTTALHFFAMQVLIGSLVAVIIYSLRGKSRGDASYLTAASVVARRLPIVMTYVINLGVPPLLFLQVLYGRTIYTSTVLIGATWISVIFLLIACYWLLYRTSDRAAKSKPTHWHALLALLLAAGVGHIYAMAMTLMLRPEVWQPMYETSAFGVLPPPRDPTMLPRWLCMMSGGLLVGGLWVALHGNIRTIEQRTSELMRKSGSAVAIVGAVLHLATGYWVFVTQPTNLQGAMSSSTTHIAFALLWAAGTVLAVILTVAHYVRRVRSWYLGWAACVAALLGVAGLTLFRDGIRDLTLASKDFVVWDRPEASNWFVIGLFLLLFVAGLGVIGWLLMIMKKATAVSEEVAA